MDYIDAPQKELIIFLSLTQILNNFNQWWLNLKVINHDSNIIANVNWPEYFSVFSSRHHATCQHYWQFSCYLT